ncbi:hypothetical protein [Microbacterium sp. MYb66]|uniref:hypothetical protein n=1 Tax=Microbacterium sp. MYb66 TaxID=1848692 RepID=UPI000CFF0F65|nr:hypothetical protein [Microbacterium sp. MYb66]PRA78406.1 hypothetical protein CQ045_18550 [Microbacterium sp. MYb66]
MSKVVGPSGQQLANVTYDALQRLQRIVYPDDSALNSVGRDAAERVVAQEWLVAGQLVSDNVVRSHSGRVVKQHTGMGATTYSSTYVYDTVGRLVSAVIPGHEFAYGFGSTGGCGPNAAAGLSGNRTGVTDVWTAPGQASMSTPTSYWPTDPIGSADLDGEFDWLFALDVVSTAIMFVPGVGTAAGLAIKAAVVATTAVRASTVVRKVASAANVVRTVIKKNNILRIGPSTNGPQSGCRSALS